MHAGTQQEECGVMGRQLVSALVYGLALAVGGQALAHAGANTSPGGSVPKPASPDQSKTAKAQGEPAKPEMAVAGNFGQWALVCGKDKDGKEPCSLVNRATYSSWLVQ